MSIRRRGGGERVFSLRFHDGYGARPVRALWSVFGAVALTAAFLYTAGTSRAGEVTITNDDATVAQQRQQVARTHHRAAQRIQRREQRAARRQLREAQRQAAVAAWVAA